MERLSMDVRLRYLAVSGGWLGRLVITTSNFLGVFDTLVLSVVIVLWYQVVRTSMKELGIVLGLYLDCAIPLQYQINESSYARHKDHLDDYWPLFFMGSLAEAAAYALLDSSSFTFMICIKSVTLSLVWIGRKQSGVFLSTALRKGESAPASQVPVGGVDWGDSVVHSSELKKARSRVRRSVAEAKATVAKPPLNPASLPAPVPPVSTAQPASKIGMDLVIADNMLKSLYPDPLVRQGMIETYRTDHNEPHAEHYLRKWSSEQDQVGTRGKKYRAKGLAARQSRADLKNNKVPIFVDDDSVEWNQQLKPIFPDPWVRYGILTKTNSLTSGRPAKITAICHEEWKVAARNSAYGEIGEAMRNLFDDDCSSGTDAATSRGGSRVANRTLMRLKADMAKKRMRLGEMAKILEVFSRSRSVQQEKAAMARLKASGITLALEGAESAIK